MADSPTATSAGRFEVRATADIHFGWIRTRLSVERTMMSWQRTATALIGFGLAIVQYLEHLQQVPGPRSAYFPDAPQHLGLALISCGILALVISLWQYLWTVRYLSPRGFERGDQVRIAAISASTPKTLIIRLRL
jgi:putative membrane protein